MVVDEKVHKESTGDRSHTGQQSRKAMGVNGHRRSHRAIVREGHTEQWSQKATQSNASGENSCRQKSSQRAKKRNGLKTLST